MNKVERFRGRSPGEAMKKARAALGDEARLVTARRVSSSDDPVPAYEVTVTCAPAPQMESSNALAGLRREIEELKQLVRSGQDRRGSSPASQEDDAPSPISSPVAKDTADSNSLAPFAVAKQTRPRSMGGHVSPGPGADTAWRDRLRRRGCGPETIERLLQSAITLGDQTSPDLGASLAEAIRRELVAQSDSRPLGRRSTIVVGPCGAGKTTTLGKIATSLVLQGVRPVLVTTDGESLSGEDTLSRIAGALGLSFETAYFSGQLGALSDRLGDRNILLVDTPGRSPLSEEGLEGLQEIVQTLPEAEILLVLAAASDRDELHALAEGFGILGVHRVVYTKLDELSRPGRLLDLAASTPSPLAWITTGRDARGTSFSPADPKVVSRILGSRGVIEAEV